MKWFAVCREQAQGVKPGDPTFTGRVSLGATPVCEVKAVVNPRGADGRGDRGGDLQQHGRNRSFRSSVRIVYVGDSRRER